MIRGLAVCQLVSVCVTEALLLKQFTKSGRKSKDSIYLEDFSFFFQELRVHFQWKICQDLSCLEIICDII